MSATLPPSGPGRAPTPEPSPPAEGLEGLPPPIRPLDTRFMSLPERARSEERRRARTGGNLLALAAILHGLAIVVSLVVLKALVEASIARSVSWDELFAAAQRAGVMGLLLAGVGFQIAFAAVAAIGAFLLYRGVAGASGPLAVIGVFAAVFSILVFGGVVGVIAGACSLIAGILAWPRQRAPPVVFAPDQPYPAEGYARYSYPVPPAGPHP